MTKYPQIYVQDQMGNKDDLNRLTPKQVFEIISTWAISKQGRVMLEEPGHRVLREGRALPEWPLKSSWRRHLACTSVRGGF